MNHYNRRYNFSMPTCASTPITIIAPCPRNAPIVEVEGDIIALAYELKKFEIPYNWYKIPANPTAHVAAAGMCKNLHLCNHFSHVFFKIIHLIFPPYQMIPALFGAVLSLQFLKVSICQCSFHGLLFCLCKKKREKKIPKIVGPTRITITKMRRISIILISTPPVDPHALSVSGSRPCAS